MRLVGGGIITGPSMYIFFCLLDMFGFAPKCMGEGGGKVTQTILGRKNVPSFKKSKMSQFFYVPEYLRPTILTPQKSYDYGI